MKLRLGNGFDVHKFGPGSSLTLCGVTIESSDQALIWALRRRCRYALLSRDAIYGALAKGDIGQHFPPSDPE